MPLIIDVCCPVGEVDLKIGQIVSYNKEMWIINRIGNLTMKLDDNKQRTLVAQVAVQNVKGPYLPKDDETDVTCINKMYYKIGSWIMDDDNTQVVVITGIKSVEYKNKQSLFCYTCEAIDLFDEETVKEAILKQRVKDLNLRLIK